MKFSLGSEECSAQLFLVWVENPLPDIQTVLTTIVLQVLFAFAVTFFSMLALAVSLKIMSHRLVLVLAMNTRIFPVPWPLFAVCLQYVPKIWHYHFWRYSCSARKISYHASWHHTAKPITSVQWCGQVTRYFLVPLIFILEMHTIRYYK